MNKFANKLQCSRIWERNSTHHACVHHVHACKLTPSWSAKQEGSAHAPSIGMLSDVLGMLSVTSSRKILNDSSTTTPIWTFCAGVQKNTDSSSTVNRVTHNSVNARFHIHVTELTLNNIQHDNLKLHTQTRYNTKTPIKAKKTSNK